MRKGIANLSTTKNESLLFHLASQAGKESVMFLFEEQTKY